MSSEVDDGEILVTEGGEPHADSEHATAEAAETAGDAATGKKKGGFLGGLKDKAKNKAVAAAENVKQAAGQVADKAGAKKDKDAEALPDDENSERRNLSQTFRSGSQNLTQKATGAANAAATRAVGGAKLAAGAAATGANKAAEVAGVAGVTGVATAGAHKAAGVAASGANKAAGAAATGANKAAGAAAVGASKAKDAAATGANKAKEVTPRLASHIGAAVLVEKTKDIIHAQRNKVDQMVTDFKVDVNRRLKEVLFKRISKLVDKIPPIVKDKLDDPYMPRVVKRGQDKFIDMSWPEVRQEIMRTIAATLDRGTRDEEFDQMPGSLCGLAFFRYHMFPYDRSFWRKLRDPVWVVLNLCSLFPVMGANQAVYTFIFIIIDKTDEYQLIDFILRFKGTQFISHGILRTIIGYFAFLGCVTGRDEGGISCDEASIPWMSGNVFPVILLFVLQVTLVWIAFFLLPYSSTKARQPVSFQADLCETKASRKGGGYLFYLLSYDLIVFLFCCVALAVSISQSPSNKSGADDKLADWRTRSMLYTAQIVYGFFSVPFFIFTLPILQTILTHSYPTAYDQKGRCRPPVQPPKPGQPENKLKEDEDLLDDQEAGRILDRTRALLTGRKPKAAEATEGEDLSPEAAGSQEPSGLPGGRESSESSGLRLGPEIAKAKE